MLASVIVRWDTYFALVGLKGRFAKELMFFFDLDEGRNIFWTFCRKELPARPLVLVLLAPAVLRLPFLDVPLFSTSSWLKPCNSFTFVLCVGEFKELSFIILGGFTLFSSNFVL